MRAYLFVKPAPKTKRKTREKTNLKKENKQQQIQILT